MNSLVNILAIVKHFQHKIKDWLAVQGLSTPTEEQVLEVVRKNYDLTLKLQDSLDHYERYVERPKHTQFFTSIVREVVIDTRKHVYAAIKEPIQAIPQELMCNVVSSTTDASAAAGAISPIASVWIKYLIMHPSTNHTIKTYNLSLYLELSSHVNKVPINKAKYWDVHQFSRFHDNQEGPLETRL